MSTRKPAFTAGEYYHVFNRGNSKQKIFLDDKDRERFIQLLYLCNSSKGFDFREQIIRTKISAWDFNKGTATVRIVAWVLMPNHFHLYITPAEARLPQKEYGDISAFMHKVLTAYSKYFNTKHKRVGALFEDKFKSVHIENENQAKYLFSYIHLNPLKLFDSSWKESGVKDLNKSTKFLNSYEWSSYLDYIGDRREFEKVIDKIDLFDNLKTPQDIKNEIFNWIKILE